MNKTAQHNCHKDQVTEIDARAWWKVEDDGHVNTNLSKYLTASD